LHRELGSHIRWRLGVPGTQRWPPVAVQPPAELRGVEGRHRVAADPACVLRDYGQPGLEERVRHGVDVARQPGITENGCAVAAILGRKQADAIKVIAVIRLVPADPYLLVAHPIFLPGSGKREAGSERTRTPGAAQRVALSGPLQR